MTPSDTQSKLAIVLECGYCVTHPDLVVTSRRHAGSPVVRCPTCGRQFAFLLAPLFPAGEEEAAE